MSNLNEQWDTMEDILVGDPNEDTQYVYFMMLQHAGFAPLLASNGQKALELAEAHRPAAMIVDLSLMTAEGRGLIQALRSQPGTREIPIVALSDGYVSAEIERETRAVCAELFRLPVPPSRVVSAIRSAVQGDSGFSGAGMVEAGAGETKKESAWDRVLRSLEG